MACLARREPLDRDLLFPPLQQRDRIALGIELLLVMKGDRFQCENYFARFVHWFNLVFEAR